MFEKGKKKGSVRFAIRPSNGISKVEVAGDFTGWLPKPLRKSKDGAYSANIDLTAGTYEYKFLLNGQWVVDPDNGAWAANSYGTVNSIAQVS